MNPQEEPIKKFHPHPFYFLLFYLSGIGFIVVSFFFLSYFLILLMTGLFVLALGEIARRAETFYVFENGVAREYKLLSTSRKFIEYDKIQDLEVSQSFFENILGIGSVDFDTAGSDAIEMTFHGVKNPYDLEKTIREKMKKV